MSRTRLVSAGIRTIMLSNMMTPPRPGALRRTKGNVCFFPLSATAQNHDPACSRSMNARIHGLSALVQLT